MTQRLYPPEPVHARGCGLRSLGPFIRRLDQQAFEERFGTEEACHAFLFKALWPQGWSCPRCPGRAYRRIDSKHLLCLRCYRRVSLTAGTILHGTRKPLATWFRAAFLVGHLNTSARVLQRVLQVTYKVAWTWAHKLRRVMESKTTLDAPVPPFDREHHERAGQTHPNIFRRWFANHGHARWTAHREGGLGTCCARLDRADWEAPIFRHTPGVARLKDALFNASQGSVSDKHLGAYFVETEFRYNARRQNPLDRTTELARRFVKTAPHPYKKITLKGKRRTPLRISGQNIGDIPGHVPSV